MSDSCCLVVSRPLDMHAQVPHGLVAANRHTPFHRSCTSLEARSVSEEDTVVRCIPRLRFEFPGSHCGQLQEL